MAVEVMARAAGRTEGAEVLLGLAEATQPGMAAQTPPCQSAAIDHSQMGCNLD